MLTANYKITILDYTDISKYNLFSWQNDQLKRRKVDPFPPQQTIGET